MSMPLCPQACTHPPKGKRKESAMSNKYKERGALKAKEGSIINYKFLLSLQSVECGRELHHSENLNNRILWYSNSLNQSDRKFVCYSHLVLNNGQQKVN